MYSTREGSQHEDLGLIAELHKAIAGVPSLVLEVGQVIRALMELGKEENLLALQVYSTFSLTSSQSFTL